MMVELSADKRWSLSRAGIGRRFHNMSVNDFGQMGTSIIEWAQANRSDVLHNGKSLLITGLQSDTYLYMLARTLHLSGVSMFVCDLIEFLPIHRGEVDEHEAYVDADVLCIAALQTEMECPLRPRELAEVERVLLRRYGDREAIFVNMPMRMSAGDDVSEYLRWWSSRLTSMLSEIDRIDAGDRS